MTDRDYADMIDPFIRAEEEAWSRGYDRGVVAGLLYAIGVGLVVAMILFASKVNAETIRFKPTPLPIRASAVEARITVCQQYRELYGLWQCYAIKETK